MRFFMGIRHHLADGRLATNLVAFYGLVVVMVVGSLMLRRWLGRRAAVAAQSGPQWLQRLRIDLSQGARTVVFWLTIVFVAVTTLAGIGFHWAGRDVRHELRYWLGAHTASELTRLGFRAAALLAIFTVCRALVWLVRRGRPLLEKELARVLGQGANRDNLTRWCNILEHYGVAMVRLIALWGAGHVLRLGYFANHTIGSAVRITTVLVCARLLTLGFRTSLPAANNLGNQYLSVGKLRRYWERITHMFTFAERCFEAAVYVWATSRCVIALQYILVDLGVDKTDIVEEIGKHMVVCIGILFGTRVLIELLQVLLNEAFGMYEEEHLIDQKGRTLVPLLQSVCQYVLYFGAGLFMLQELGMNMAPVLAGAGIVGLAVGLGAQNLVTDVVSGFFILFEGQYLVGDYVQIGDASGVVESVGIRLTQVRDDQGKLYIIPNGQIKGVVNYSKDYVNAVVDLKLSAGNDLESVFQSMAEAGKRLRQARKEVLADTQIQGLIDLSTSDMTVRAVTRVRPGTHVAMQNEYRRLLKQVVDQKPIALQAKAA